jgi:hypothetical protein
MKPSLLLLTLACALGMNSGATPGQQEIKEENLDSLASAFRSATSELTTPEFERRKQALLLLQRQGYVQTLYDVIAGDGPGALISLARVHARIEYRLPHNQLYVYISPTPRPQAKARSPWQFLAPESAQMSIPLVQDWTFPADPWEKP